MQREHYEHERQPQDASHLTVGIVVSEFNTDITSALLEGARDVLRAWQVKDERIHVLRVPGSFELPYGCRLLLSREPKPQALIALGCIIKGETDHDKYVASAATQGIVDLTLSSGVPIAFGVITTNTLEQAKVRSTGKANKGREAAETALTLALL